MDEDLDRWEWEGGYMPSEVTTITVRVADLEQFATLLDAVKREAAHSLDPATRRILTEAIQEFFNGSTD